MRTIDSIVIHCSDTIEGKHFTAADIRRWHIARGFADIGYHYVITLDGEIQPGRPVDMIGAHCKQQRMNHVSIGICYIGGRDPDGKTYRDTRTPAQKTAMHSLVARLRKQYGIPADRIFGHRDFAPKACPCFDVHKEQWE